MSNPQIIGLFAVPVFTADNIGGKTTIKDLKSFDMSDNRPGMQNLSDTMNVLGDPRLETLRHAIHVQVLQYLFIHLGIDSKYKIDFVSSWVSKLKYGSNHTEHFHPCSQWSGVYYPEDQDEAACLEFWSPHGEIKWVGGNLIPDRKGSFHTRAAFSYETPGDRLILFPSDQPHKVTWPHNILKAERYSLAFNIMLSGEYTTPAQTVRLFAEPL